MLIKKNNISVSAPKTKPLKKTRRLFLISFLFAFTLLIGVFSGILINQNNIIKTLPTIKQDLLYFFGGEVLTNIKNYFKAQRVIPEEFIIDINQINYDKLAYNRNIALERGILMPDCRDEVPADITWQGKKYRVKLRLKGDLPDHWSDEKKWSFRISVSGDEAIMGMKNFSIQAPETRGNLNEWVYHKLLRYNDLIALRYDFVSVKLNGTDLGIYALEEFFEKRLIENNSRREGPIFRFDESLFMPLLIVKPTDISDIVSFYKEGYTIAQIDPFQTNRVLADTSYFKRFLTAKNLMESFRMGKLKTSDVFDVPKIALYFAVNDLVGQWGYGLRHAIEYRNIRFYFNPFNGKIEPIGFDNGYIWHTSQNGILIENPENYDWVSLFFQDEEFVNQYIIALNKISDKSYLDKFFNEIRSEMNTKLAILYRLSPKYRFYGESILYDNQNYIKTVLNHPAVINAHFFKIQDNKLTLKVANRQWMPMEITELRYKDSLIIKPIENVIIPPKRAHELMDYTEVSFIVPSGINWSPLNLINISIVCKSNALHKEYTSTLIPWNYNDWTDKDIKFNLSPSIINEYNFLIVDETNKKVIIKPGKHILNKNLVIPQGYKVIAKEGTTIDLRNKANFISFSPVDFIGNADEPISFISSDSTGQGFALLSTSTASYFEYVNFDNLSHHNQDSWVLTGSVTLYEADATMRYCNFSNNRAGDDILNFVRCKFWIDNSNFINAFADALDGDFVKGIITNCYFNKPGNDGLDFSGSTLLMKNIIIDSPGDKGISFGEATFGNGENIKITGGEIAVAAKDLAKLKIDNLTINDAKLGFTVYQKKPEFGKGYILTNNFNYNNIQTLHLVESGSYLVINNNIIQSDMDDVKEVLYGMEYGKASVR